MAGPITIAKYACLFVVYLLTHLVPRDESLWIYGYNQGTSFTDNSKYLYLHANRHCEGTRDVWFSRDERLVAELRREGYEAYRYRSVRGCYLALRAKYAFITHNRKDVPWWLTGGATVVRLGHGIPFKRYGYDEERRIRQLGRLKLLAYKLFLRNYDYTIATSHEQAANVASAMRLPIDRVWVTGLPRMDALFDGVADEDVWCVDHSRFTADRPESGPLLFYFPTWRRNTTSFPSADLFAEIDRVLDEADATLITRNHPSDSRLDASEYEHVRSLPPGKDFYPLLKHVDLFITDYSSLFYDSLYRRTELLFFPYDYGEYTTSRSFYYDYFDLPGTIATEPAAFVTALETRLETLPRADSTNIEREWFERTFTFRDRRNCERVVERVQSL